MSLIALEDANEALQDIDYWVIGGYAIDIAVGQITREHKNADILIKLNDTGKAITQLNKKGYTITYERDKLTANKNGHAINLIILYENKEHYILTLLNTEIEIPKKLMDKTITGQLEDKTYKRIPNELLYLMNRYSLKQTDATIVTNLPINKKQLKEIKIKIKH